MTREELNVLHERYRSRSSTKRLVITDAVQVHKDVLSLISRIEELEDGMRRIYAGSLGEGFQAKIAKRLTECS